MTQTKEPVGAIYVFILEDGTVDVQSVYEPERTQEILKVIASSNITDVREIDVEDVQEDYEEE